MNQGVFRGGPFNNPDGPGSAGEKSTATLGGKELALLSGIGLLAILLIGIAVVALKKIPPD